MTLLFISAGSTYPQNKIISNVPDYNQPPQQTLPSTTNTSNYCSPFAALNIISFWEFARQNAYAYGATAGLQPAAAAEYIGWYMSTNGLGSPNRLNIPPASLPGTPVIDQLVGMTEYLAADSLNRYGFPYSFPPLKRGTGWDILPEPPDFLMYTMEIDQGNPVKLDFLHWNIKPAGVDTVINGDTVSVYSWGPFVPSSGTVDESDPPEEWNGIEGDMGIGHAVTGVGYLLQFQPPGPPGPLQDYAIVHDNWPNTPENIAVPWQNLQAIFHVRLPAAPDFAVSDLYTRRDGIVTDTLYVMQPFDLIVVVRNHAGPWFLPYILISSVLDIIGTPLAVDTSYQVYAGQPTSGDSMLVFIDSIYIPQKSGQIDLRAEIFWDLNQDSLINDPSDKDSLNDFNFVSRRVLPHTIRTPIELIPGVPDQNQPPTATLPSTLPGNFCAPVATANILYFWDNIANYPDAQNVTAGLPPETMAEYIGWFYDTNDRGNPGAQNGTALPSAAGTYMADQDSFTWTFIRWDSLNPYMAVAPPLPGNKHGYDWKIASDYSVGTSFYKSEIDAGRPLKVDFTHWNIKFTGSILVDPQDQDTVYLYQWGPPVSNAQLVDPNAPEESWNLEEGKSNIGHAVTGVGYLQYNGFHVIVHDNWSTTHRAVCLPWQNWEGTLAMDPTQPVDIKSDASGVPSSYKLHQNSPNPFNQTTSIHIDLPEKTHVTLDIYDILGRRIAVLVDHNLSAGRHRIDWDAGTLPTGIYIYRLITDNYVEMRKSVILK